MFSPITGMTGNLLWTRTGTVWATFRLSPLPYGYRPTRNKADVRAAHTALFRSLRGEALLLGIAASVDPVSVVQRMIEGIELEERPGWTAECEATLDLLEQIDLGRRGFWLSVPLPNDGTSRVMEPARAAWADLKDQMGMPRTLPSPRQIEHRLEQADAIRRAVPGVFDARPVSVAEQVWLQIHAQQRGLGLDLAIPGQGQDVATDLLTTSAAIPSPLLDPCGQTDPGHSKAIAPNILRRRFLKVLNPDLDQASYQTMLTLTEAPSGGIEFPGGEWLGRIDESGEVVDWALRLTIRGRQEVTAHNRRAHQNIQDQVEQREGDDTVGAASYLAGVAAELAEYQAIMDSDTLEVEAEATAIFTVAAATPEEVQNRAQRLRDYLSQGGFKLSIDPTAQEDLWWASLPGTPTSRVVRELSQIAPARGLAVAVPVISTDLGDDQGSMFALEVSTGRPSPVLVDLAGSGAKLETAMAVAFAGELGSGKSTGMKTLTGDAVDRGADVLAIDRSESAEWVKAFSGIPGAVVIDVSEDATVSCDPLRLFNVHSAGRIAQSFFTVMLNIAPTSTEGTALSDVLDPAYLQQHGVTSTGALLRHLPDSDVAGAAQLASKMRVFARKDFSRAIFDDSLPVADVSSPAIVFRTHRLELPDADELNHEHRFRQMRLEKVFGRAVYALITATARQRCFHDRRHLSIFVVDEAHSVTSSPEGLNELKIFLRDGRKHMASLVIGSHDPEADFGDEVLRGLIPFRVLMRHRDRTLAERGLRWVLGLTQEENVDEALVDLIAQETSPVSDGGGVRLERRGECLVRDFQARIGRCKILAPAVPDRAAAVFTTPGESSR